MVDYLTTREVAALLRVKERKVYELVADRAIPASRVTGKLLFPRDLIEGWVRRHIDYRGDVESLRAYPPVVAGSHDPLLDWAVRESGCGLAMYFDGSLDGLARLRAGEALVAGMHMLEPETGDFNRAHVERDLGGQSAVLVEWAWRTQGLVVPRGNPRRIAGVGDLRGLRVIPRQVGAGSHALLHHLLAESGMADGAARLLDPPARTEADVALAVADGRADAGLAVESVARQHRLDFVPLFRERYDLLAWRREYFEPPLQKLLAITRTARFRERAESFGGYDVSGLGTVRWNGR
ncbi:MAG: helix-turn-helix transcriptional regulator [Ectothiorhodospiraceae bacterium]|nr:helix-turn-helix transcriptional regulator [Ectothiorhodospiraceae bacterium]